MDVCLKDHDESKPLEKIPYIGLSFSFAKSLFEIEGLYRNDLLKAICS